MNKTKIKMVNLAIVTLVVIAATAVNYVFAADPPPGWNPPADWDETTIYTPENSPVTAYEIDEFGFWDIVFYNWAMDDLVDEENWWAFRIGNASARYNCHAYAWYMYGTSNDPVWLQYWDLEEFYTDGSYEACSDQDNPPEFAKVKYYGTDHSAVLRYYMGEKSYYSKWGDGPVYWHDPGHDPFYFGQYDDGAFPYYTYYCP